uniref:Sushi domain-containing protein n=1 Tax=Caenorhabditis japonica TaxID=281687 RepID=A0A8R1DVB2_CAEJA
MQSEFDDHQNTNLQMSSWQCAQSQMEIVGVFGEMCYAASRDEQTDWLGAQRKCLDRSSTLPLRIDDSTRRGLRAALSSSSSSKAFYWIGASSSMTEWRWVDGEGVGDKADWSGEPYPIPSASEAVLLARPLDWKWVPASQTAWNSFLCQSKPKFCTSPGVGEATKVTFSSHSYAIGTLCFYSCDSGYDLHGTRQRECADNGRWTGTIPNCFKKSCGAVRQWKFGKIRLLNKTTLYKSEVEYECSNGWHLLNSPYPSLRSIRRVCQSDGSWSGSEPSCELVDCGRPPLIANGGVDVESTTYESTANYTCHRGFRLIGPESLTCGGRGEWQPATPFCYDVTTLQEIKGSNAHEQSNGNTDGTIAVAVLAFLLVACLSVAVLKLSRPTPSNGDLSVSRDKLNASNVAIYATPSIPPQRPDSVIYYAPTVAHMEVPPHLLHLQQLPNGNIHVTLPIGRQMGRPSLPMFNPSIPPPSPTPSQILYSFDHEPIYDTPPDTVIYQAESVYERLPSRPAPPPPPLPIRAESGGIDLPPPPPLPR